ncbi:MAG TPA: aminotransferase class III-fold pyridoxal phosphate-dependent enzyme [Gemmatimonadales bacterium]|nr:aminotransferase class III-fold pyridoxal phosphate-dependent enzyme [Gemmatimonadales bacterium]
MDRVAGFTSTGSKRREALFGEEPGDAPGRMSRSAGCRVWDDRGREYLDYIMALGAVGLGYGHPAVAAAAHAAVDAGVVGPLAPELEEAVAAELCRLIPWVEQVRFVKSGAEAVAAAVRLARVATGRSDVLGCGYHGWLDWCQTGAGRGTPDPVRALYAELPFNDPEQTRSLIRSRGDRLAAVVIEPFILVPPSSEWTAVVQEETRRVGAVLIVDEIKTVCRLAIGGGCERFGIRPDLVVLGKAIANGFPLAAVGGRAELMDGVRRTWISSTLASEMVSLAAARATLEVMVTADVPAHLDRVGDRLLAGLRSLAARYPAVVAAVRGIGPMCFLECRSEPLSGRLAVGAARRGLLFKRSAYNFVSLAHDDTIVDRTLGLLDDVLQVLAP